ncbi:MAG: hypothetical protein O2958_11615 [Gemmatimonadetes bacterium]|nr:hypothetical protein [Gemmatimonadota bacterium]MDA1104516.1 hypothetical protein [Gemmatimonadota bacterium]
MPTTTTLSPNSQFYAQVGYIVGNSISVQEVRAGGSPITVTFTSSAPRTIAGTAFVDIELANGGTGRTRRRVGA